MRAVFLGAGYLARALIPKLKARGFFITGTARTERRCADISRRLDIQMLKLDSVMTDELKDALRAADYIISSAPPASGRDPIIAAAKNTAKNTVGQDIAAICPKCRYAAYLSATSVYGDRGGQWAFEDELLTPASPRGVARAQAEMDWIETGLPLHIFRLAGIYGPDETIARAGTQSAMRSAISRVASGQARAVIKPGYVSNRIHVDDAARAILMSMDSPDPVQIYNIADGNPAPPQDVLAYGAKLQGLPPLQAVDFSAADLSPMARSFYLENKRVDISRARMKLNWQPKFPTYQEGLTDIYRKRLQGVSSGPPNA